VAILRLLDSVSIEDMLEDPGEDTPATPVAAALVALQGVPKTLDPLGSLRK